MCSMFKIFGGRKRVLLSSQNSISEALILLDQNDYNKLIEDLAKLVLKRASSHDQNLTLETAKDLVLQFIHQACNKADK